MSNQYTDLKNLRQNIVGINSKKFGRIFCFIDYGNVNYWYEKDRKNADGTELLENQKLIVDIQKLANFVAFFSKQKRFYYGWNSRKSQQSSWHILIKAERFGFIKITKPIQFIKHFMVGNEMSSADSSQVKFNQDGYFIEIPKSNFDVEISVDAIRLSEQYDAFCLFSGDSDFTYLAQYLKQRGKKIIVVASGQVFHTLKDLADLYVNAQTIKPDITSVKETTPRKGRGLDIGSASGGQGSR